MEFKFTPQQEAFRREVKQFLKENLPPDWDGFPGLEPQTEEELAFSKAFMLKEGERALAEPAWPKEYGGRGLSYIEQAICREEMAYQRAPDELLHIARDIVGPSILVLGNEEQKRKFLPPIAGGKLIFCQTFSEPDSGSDLASIQTQAVEAGNEFIINGQKVWISFAHRADYCWLLARTHPHAPKHRGLSLFIVPMDLPGISVRPLLNMAGEYSFSEVFFDGVRVPREYLVGEKNMGWLQSMTTLGFERSRVWVPAGAKRTLDELIDYVKEGKMSLKVNHHNIKQKLADRAIEIEVARLIAYRIVWMLTKGETPFTEASMMKILGDQVNSRVVQTGLEILGLYGQLEPDSKWSTLRGRLEKQYLWSIGLSIAAGTHEIQRNIIALRGLGLPRG